jgi:hypothetical protein
MEGRMKNMVNLLPTTFRRQQYLRKRLSQWGSIVCIVLVSGWAWHWYEMQENKALTQQLEVLTREQAPTQTMLKQLVDMRKTLEELQQQEAVATELESQRNALALLGVVSQSAYKTNGRLRVTKLTLSNFQGGATQPAPTGAPQTNGLVLAGESLDNPAVAELLDGLQESGLFSKVEFTLKERADDPTASLRDYEVRCDF